MIAAAALLALLLQQPDTVRPVRADSVAQQDSVSERDGRDRREQLPPPTPAQLADAYRDEVARDLVERARSRRRTIDTSIDAYDALARERIAAGLRLPGRDRTLYRRETATRIEWRREGPIRLNVLGSREVIPPVRGAPQIPEDLRSFVPHLAFDPVDSEMLMRLNNDGWRNPLALGAERDYRYESGDTTEIRLPDGRTVRLVELRVLPRRSDFRLVTGSFWIEQETNAVVQAVFRPSRPFDLDEDDDGDDVPGLLKPVRFELAYVTLEYAYWDFRWWLPRTVAAEGVLQVTSLLRMPFSYSLSYTDYSVEGDPTRPRIALPDSVIDRQRCTPAVRMTVNVDTDGDRRTASTRVGTIADGRQGDTGAAAARDSASERRPRRFRMDESTGRGEDGCGRELIVELPADSAELLASSHLPPSIYENDADWDADLRRVRELAEQLGNLDEAPWQSPRPTFAWGLGAPGLVRYNRVEGLSVGARSDLDLGRLRLDATARLALAKPRPDLELGITRPTLARDYRLTLYNGVRAVDPDTRPFGIGNSLNALVLGREDGEYYEALGASLEITPAATRAQWYGLRLFAERHDAIETETDFSLPHVFDDGRTFRPNIVADEVDLFGGELALHAGIGRDPAGWQGSASLVLDGAGGDVSFGRSALTVRTGFPLFAKLRASLEGGAGTSTGDVPVQRMFYLGGPATLRGYDGSSAVGTAFWRARAEIARGWPLARVAVFGDVAWAGDRESFTSDGALRSLGIGATFLDGLVRADLARGLDGPEDWRFDLWVSW